MSNACKFNKRYSFLLKYIPFSVTKIFKLNAEMQALASEVLSNICTIELLYEMFSII